MRALLIIPFLFGCAQLAEVEDRATDRGAQVVTYLCEEADERDRQDYIDDINAKSAPYSFSINCGEPE